MAVFKLISLINGLRSQICFWRGVISVGNEKQLVSLCNEINIVFIILYIIMILSMFPMLLCSCIQLVIDPVPGSTSEEMEEAQGAVFQEIAIQLVEAFEVIY